MASRCYVCGRVIADDIGDLCSTCIEPVYEAATQGGEVDATLDMTSQSTDPVDDPVVTLDSSRPGDANSPAEDATLPPDDDQRGEGKSTVVGTTVRYFGDYELLEEIARGGMGVVYKARQVSLNRIVALKMILTGQLASDQDVQRFRTEAEAAANLDHPGIVPIFEIGEHDGQHFFSMGFVEGQSLADRLADGPLPPREAAALTKKLATAIAYAHERGVIHRDLKPANVLLDKSGEPRITDFGLAKKLEADSNLTGTGQILGTPSYMPPEQAAGKTDKVTPVADVYALGAILYALLTGRPPFQAANPMDTLLQVLGSEPVAPRQLDSAIPRDLETICLKCLDKQANRRYAAAENLAEDLGRFSAGLAVLARPLGRPARLLRWCRRYPWAALFLVTLIVATGISLVLTTYALQQADEALRQRARAEAEVRLSEGLVYAGLIAKADRDWEDGNRQDAWDDLHSCQWNLRGWEHDFLYTKFTKDAYLQSDSYNGDKTSIAFRPDGMQFALSDSLGFVQVWDATNGLHVQSLVAGSPVSQVAWSRDGRQLAVTTSTRGVLVWDAREWKLAHELRPKKGCSTSVGFTGRKHHIVVGGSEGLELWDLQQDRRLHEVSFAEAKLPGRIFLFLARSLFAMSWDGAVLATPGYSAKRKEGIVTLWDAESLEQKTILRTSYVPQSVSFDPSGQRLAIGEQRLPESTRVTSLSLWDLSSGKRLWAIDSPSGNFRSLAFCPDGRWIVGSGSFWDADDGQLITKLEGDGFPLAVAPDAQTIAAGGDYGPRVWRAPFEQQTRTLEGYIDPMNSLAVSRDGSVIVTGGQDGKIRVWEGDAGNLLLTIDGVGQPIRQLRLSDDGRIVASAISGGMCQLWRLDDGHLLATIQANAQDLSLSPGLRAITTIESQQLREWTVVGEEATPEVTFEPDPKARATIKCFHAGTHRVAMIRNNTDLEVWNTASKARVFQSEVKFAGAIAFSPDGERLVVVGGNDPRAPALRVLNAANGARIYEVAESEGQTWAGHGHVAFHPDGHEFVVSKSPSTSLLMHDTATGRVKRQLTGHTHGPNAVQYSGNGKRIVSAGSDGTIKVWDAMSGKELQSFKVKGHSGAIRDLAWLPDGQQLVSASDDGTAIIWNVNSESQVATLQADQGKLVAVGVTSRGDGIITAGEDRVTRFWDRASGKQQPRSLSYRLNDHPSPTDEQYASLISPLVTLGSDARWLAYVKGREIWVYSTGGERRRHLVIEVLPEQIGYASQSLSFLQFSPDGRRIACGYRNCLELFDVSDGKSLVVMRGHREKVNDGSFSPDGQRIATAGDDGTVRLWDVSTGQERLNLRGHGRALSVAFGPDGTQLASGGEDGKIRIWNASRHTNERRLTAERTHGATVSWQPHADKLAVPSNGGLQMWDTTTGKPLPVRLPEIRLARFLPGTHRVVTTTQRDWGAVQIWDAVTARLVREFVGTRRGDNRPIERLEVSSDGRRFAILDSDGVVRIFDAESGRQVAKLDGAHNCVALGPKGERMVTGSRHGRSATLWEVKRTVSQYNVIELNATVNDVVFDPNGQWVAIASSGDGGIDGVLSCWDASTGEQRYRVPAAPQVTRLAVSPNGHWIAGGLRDSRGTVAIWESETGRLLVHLRSYDHDVVGDPGQATSLAFSTDNRQLAVLNQMDADNVSLWDLAELFK